ncbi:MAG: hypothetical protein ABFS35_21560 [Bacteroidota bacterium]
MNKTKLKTGMLVKFRRGDIFMVINNMLVAEDKHNPINDYNLDMTHRSHKEIDIVAVSHVLEDCFLIPQNWTEEVLKQNLLWTEKENIDWSCNPLVRGIYSGNLVRVTANDGEDAFSGVVLECKNLDGANYHEIGGFDDFRKSRFKQEK